MQNSPMSGMGGYLTKYSDGIIYWHWVTDVQYDDSIEELRKDYQSMEKQIDKVLDSLVVNE